MRSSIFLVGASVAALVIANAAGSAQVPTDGQPLCRRAPALSPLRSEAAPPELNSQTRDEPLPEDGVDGARRDRPSPPAPPAPPPLPAPAIMPPPTAVFERSSDDRGSVVATGSIVRRSGSMPPARSDESDGRPGSRRPPSGLLTAGDHDDLLNPMLYARYANRAMRALGQRIARLPRVDTRRVLTISVQDRIGRPAPFVPVTITCADGNRLTLSTLADGSVAYFPTLDRLGRRVRIEAGGARRTVEIDANAGGQTQALVVRGAAQPVRKFDLMVALDTTGSMGDEIEFLKSELRAIVTGLQRDHPELDMRVGLVAYRDIGDEYVTRTDMLSRSFNIVQRSLDRARGSGGGDMPEAMDAALARAVGQEWRPDAVKSLLLVADAPPHDDKQGLAFAIAEAARARRIQIVPVAASGVDARAEYFMRAIASLTQSRYIFLTDDSGIGNAHAEPDVDCYVVTQLDQMIRRVLNSQISGQRIEPGPQEVMRTVGRYDHGRCVLPQGFSVQ